MTKSIFIYEHKESYKIAREVETKDGLPIEYTPVFIIEKERFDIKMFREAVFTSFDGAGVVIKSLEFGKSKEAYTDYQKYMMNAYQEKSWRQQAKSSTLFILDWEHDNIKFVPMLYTKQGNEGDEEHICTISTHRKHKLQIAQEIIDLINAYSNKVNHSSA